MTSTTRVLMCEPRHYRIAYEINPWMRRSVPVLTEAAREQWLGLHATLLRLGVEVSLIDQRPEVPDLVFTANAGIVSGRRFVPTRFHHEERQGEEPIFRQWFADRGYEVVELPGGYTWEGEGDALEAADGRVFGGWGIRTERAALDALGTLLGVEVTPLELVNDRFYHLDTCFFPVDATCALYYPPAFSPESRERLAGAFPDLVAVPEEEANRFACNALLVRDTVVLNDGTERTAAALHERGYRTAVAPTSEFIKAGGSVKCLVLTLDTFLGGVHPAEA